MIPCDTLEWSKLCILMGLLYFGGEKIDLILHYNVNGTFNKCVFCTMSWQKFDVSHNYVNSKALLFYWMQIFFQPKNLIFVIYTKFFLGKNGLNLIDFQKNSNQQIFTTRSDKKLKYKRIPKFFYFHVWSIDKFG